MLVKRRAKCENCMGTLWRDAVEFGCGAQECLRTAVPIPGKLLCDCPNGTGPVWVCVGCGQTEDPEHQRRV